MKLDSARLRWLLVILPLAIFGLAVFWNSAKVPPDGGWKTTSGPADDPRLPAFPWLPPAASASYVLPDKLFEKSRTVGDVVSLIITALEQNGYVERSFFRTGDGGVALVTRLERIDDEGSPFPERERWPPGAPAYPLNTREPLMLLRGLFFVDPGRYRTIVFILQGPPFSQSPDGATPDDATAWLKKGVNVLSPLAGSRAFDGNHCTVLIYEFSSDGSAVRPVTSRLTGKQHLERAGVYPLLAKVH